MADKKITELTAQTDALASGDLVPVVDVSDTTQGAGGSTKKATMTQIAAFTDAQGLASHLADTTDAHDASAISNVAAGNIVATDVQAAINELDSEKLGTTAHDSADHSSAMSTVILDDISDVTITAAASGDLLRWNGSAWVDYADSNFAAAGHDHAATYQPLDADLTDIAAISDVQGDIIIRGASGWERLAAGTSGHFLKTQGAGANPTWAAAPAGGSVATDAIFDAKGDLPVGTGADTASKLTVGTAGQVLIAASGESTGLLWRHTGLGPQGVAGRYYHGTLGYDVIESEAWIADRVGATLFYVPFTMGIDRIGTYVTTAVASSTMYIGIYLPDDTDGLPGTKVVDSTSLDCSTTGFKEQTISTTLTTGIYWACFQTGSTATHKTRTTTLSQRMTIGRAAGSDAQPTVSLNASRTAAALPASLAGTSWSYGNVPHGVLVRST